MKNVLKKLTKTATQVLNNCKRFNNTLLKSDDFIGSGVLAIKSGLISSFDAAYQKCIEKGFEVKSLPLGNLLPNNYKLETTKVETVEIRENATKLTNKNGSVYIDTTYYMYFTSKLKNVELFLNNEKIFNGINLVVDNKVVGIIMPLRVTNEKWNDDKTLEDLKRELEEKEVIKNKNNDFLNRLVDEYKEHHSKSLREVSEQFKNIETYSIEKINKEVYQVVGIDAENKKHYYFRLTMLNADVNLTEQKKIFTLLKNYLLSTTKELQSSYKSIDNTIVKAAVKEDKINDLTALEVAADTENNIEEVENMSIKANNIVESLEIEKGATAKEYIDYLESKGVDQKDSKNIFVLACRFHLVKYGKFKSDAIVKAAEKEGVKSIKALEEKYFNRLVKALKEENENNMEVDEMKTIMYKSHFKGWVKVTEEQKEKLVKHLKSNTPAIKHEDKEEYINSRFKYTNEVEEGNENNIEEVENMKEFKLHDSELEKIVNDIVISMQDDTITKLELIENNIKCTYISKYQEEKTCLFFKCDSKLRLNQVYNKLTDIYNPGQSFDSSTTDKELLKNEISILENRLNNIDAMIQKFSHDEDVRLAYRQIENNVKYVLGAAEEILKGLEVEPATEEFYIKNDKKQYVKVEGFKLDNKYNFDIFYHEIALGNYIITHKSTGVAIGGTITGSKERLIEKIDNLVEKHGIDKVIEMFNHAIEKEGLINISNQEQANHMKEEFQHDTLDMSLQLLATEPSKAHFKRRGSNNTLILIHTNDENFSVEITQVEKGYLLKIQIYEVIHEGYSKIIKSMSKEYTESNIINILEDVKSTVESYLKDNNIYICIDTSFIETYYIPFKKLTSIDKHLYNFKMLDGNYNTIEVENIDTVEYYNKKGIDLKTTLKEIYKNNFNKIDDIFNNLYADTNIIELFRFIHNNNYKQDFRSSFINFMKAAI